MGRSTVKARKLKIKLARQETNYTALGEPHKALHPTTTNSCTPHDADKQEHFIRPLHLPHDSSSDHFICPHNKPLHLPHDADKQEPFAARPQQTAARPTTLTSRNLLLRQLESRVEECPVHHGIATLPRLGGPSFRSVFVSDVLSRAAPSLCGPSVPFLVFACQESS
jgi:hypothetical protein